MVFGTRPRLLANPLKDGEAFPDCNRTGTTNSSCESHATNPFFGALNDEDDSPFLQETVVRDGITYFHLIVGTRGEPTVGDSNTFAQEVYIQVQSGTDCDLTNGNDTANGLTQVFLKNTLTQKPKITQNVSDSGISTQFVLDMSNSNYTTNATAGLMTNTVTLVGANAGIQGNFDAAGTGTNFTTANAQTLNVTGGRFIYNPGTGWSGSGSTATYNAGSYAYVDNGGVNLTTLDWNSFRDPADNLMNFGGSLVQRKRSGNICKNGSASGPSAAGITAGC